MSAAVHLSPLVSYSVYNKPRAKFTSSSNQI